MIEPLVASSFAAAAAGTAVAVLAMWLPRRSGRRRRERPASRRIPIPGLGASRSAARRRREMDREIPQLLDLLAAASAAGLSALAGFRRAVAGLRGPLGAELGASLDAVDLGGRWRSELSVVSDRVGLPDLRRVVTILGRTEALGTSLTDATRDLAADVRAARRAATAERARAAPVKMLFPLVFLILPAFLLLTVVPVLLTTVRSIG